MKFPAAFRRPVFALFAVCAAAVCLSGCGTIARQSLDVSPSAAGDMELHCLPGGAMFAFKDAASEVRGRVWGHPGASTNLGANYEGRIGNVCFHGHYDEANDFHFDGQEVCGSGYVSQSEIYQKARGIGIKATSRFTSAYAGNIDGCQRVMDGMGRGGFSGYGSPSFSMLRY